MITIYQDIDGVINALSPSPPRTMTGWHGEWSFENILGYHILWSEEHLDALRALDAREDVTFKWLTTWEDLAVQEFAPKVGIGADWEVVHAQSYKYSLSTWWKLQSIQQDVDATEPDKIVWLDDDIQFEGKALRWVDELGSRILAISPVSNLGVTRRHIDDILRFIDDTV